MTYQIEAGLREQIAEASAQNAAMRGALQQCADRLSAWRDGAHIAFNSSGNEEQYNLRGNYDGLLSLIQAALGGEE